MGERARVIEAVDQLENLTDQGLCWVRAGVDAVVAERNLATAPDGAVGWNPWRALRRAEGVRLAWGDLGGMGGRIDVLPPITRYQVTLDANATSHQHAAALTHELIHRERWETGEGLMLKASTPRALRAAEEAEVRRFTRLRMAFYSPERWVW